MRDSSGQSVHQGVTPQTVTLRGVDGQTTLVARNQIKSLQASPVSLMPEGMTEQMKDQQVRDLFAYLMSRTPTKRLGSAESE